MCQKYITIQDIPTIHGMFCYMLSFYEKLGFEKSFNEKNIIK